MDSVGKWSTPVLALLSLVSLPLTFAAGQAPAAISVHEAEILIYLLPVAHQLRSEGMDVGWELQDQNRDHYPKGEYYVFWLVNNKRVSAGSTTIGYYAVNKHTGEIWNTDLDQLVSSSELEGVQKILRRAHGVDDKMK